MKGRLLSGLWNRRNNRCINTGIQTKVEKNKRKKSQLVQLLKPLERNKELKKSVCEKVYMCCLLFTGNVHRNVQLI